MNKQQSLIRAKYWGPFYFHRMAMPPGRARFVVGLRVEEGQIEVFLRRPRRKCSVGAEWI